MTDCNDVPNSIEEEIRTVFENRSDDEFQPGETPVRLSSPTYGTEEVIESLDSLLSTWVTMGEKVETFEGQWADYIGTNHSTMVNSGSSANLLALKALEGDIIKPGDEVIVPAVSWSTSVFPIVDVNAKPVLVDVDPSTYTIDVEAFKEAVTDDTAAVVLVHLLGNPCEMGPIMDICKEHDIAVIEDSCEAHGAEYDGQKVGSFGDIGTFSFFFSHHISTIEGGMITTDSEEYLDRNRAGRAHGWVREMESKDEYVRESPEIDERYLFVSHGYNLRPTEIQGAFGIHQLNRLEKFIDIRRANARKLNAEMDQFDDLFDILHERPDTRCSWFAYPILIRDEAPFTQDELREHLESKLIETRPILAGNLARQPALKQIDYRQVGKLEDADLIHENGLFVGNHHKMGDAQIEYILESIEEFVSEYA
ncbi:DegT/DnrJ/EryC1/StrS family aminotransferase [Haloarcula halophila]|uniref:DegT/DnrJ/EryC1/StrS family aminotransferase n=1 Tax=Haloarcula TaxID=2237 RepID=UPI00362456FF